MGAIEAALPGAWRQRCRTHYLRNLVTKVPKSSRLVVATLVRTIFEQRDSHSAGAQHTCVFEQLTHQLPIAADHVRRTPSRLATQSVRVSLTCQPGGSAARAQLGSAAGRTSRAIDVTMRPSSSVAATATARASSREESLTSA